MSAERDRLLALVNASWTTQAIGSAVRLGLPRALGDVPGSTSEWLAAALSTHASSLERLMRALATLDLVERDPEGRWWATPTGRLLDARHAETLASWAEFCAGASWDAWGRLDDSVRTGISHRARERGRDGFDHLDDNAQAATNFHRAMCELTRPIAESFATKIDLRGARSVVDVGGGAGELAVALLATRPTLRATVLDLAHAEPEARRLARERGVEARFDFVAGDFFAAVPGDADVYLVKSVLHDCTDADAIRLLGSIRAAMGQHGRVFVVERLITEPPGHSEGDRWVARSDLNMLVGTGGRERCESEFVALLEEAGLAAEPARSLIPTYFAIEARRAAAA
jgi:SAM-dependent methyltransferase